MSTTDVPSANGSGLRSNVRPHPRPAPLTKCGQRQTMTPHSSSFCVAPACLHGVCGRAGRVRAIGSASRSTRLPHVPHVWCPGSPRGVLNVGAGQHRTRAGSGPGSGVGHPRRWRVMHTTRGLAW